MVAPDWWNGFWGFISDVTPDAVVTAAITGLSLLAGIWIATRLNPRATAKLGRQAAKERVLRMMVGSWLTPGAPDWQTAIASIPIDFPKNRDVLQQRDNYLAHVGVNDAELPEDARLTHQAVQKRLQRELMEALAKDVGIPLTAASLEKGACLSGGYVYRDQLAVDTALAMKEIPGELRRSNELLEISLGLRKPPGDAEDPIT